MNQNQLNSFNILNILNMAKLNNLPQELMGIMCDLIARNDMIAFRHTDRQLR